MTRLKKLFVAVVFGISILSMSGCMSIVEKITFNKNGSGDYALSFDMSEMMVMLKSMGDMGGMLGGEGEGEGGDANQLMSEKRDTVINFSELAAANDEIKKPDFWKNVNMHIKMDSEEGILVSELKFPFETADDITYFYENIGKLSGDGNADLGVAAGFLKGLGGDGNAENANVFGMKKRNFTRKSGAMNLGDLDEETKGQLDMVKMFMSNATYKTVYSFATKVKSASNEEAKISADGKTVTTTIPLVDMLEGKGSINNEIKLKRR